VDFEEAWTLVDNHLFDSLGKHLDDVETIILRAAWDDIGYNDTAPLTPYSENQIRTYISRKLFAMLTSAIGGGQKITKKSFREFVEQRYAKKFATVESGLTLIGNLPDVTKFYGRIPLLKMLKQTVLENRCVVVRGVAGIGKSALVAKMINGLVDGSTGFEICLWKSIHHAPSIEDLLTECLGFLGKKGLCVPESNHAKISQLIKLLCERNCLLVLDSAESVLQGVRIKHLDQYGPYAEYGILLRRILEEAHQSCVLLTSREPFRDITTMHNKGYSANTVVVEGLGKDALPILSEKELSGQEGWGDLIHDYRGNPLALRMVASRIQKFFNGDVVEFRECETTFVPDIFESTLDDYFGINARLNSFEQEIMYFLAQESEKEPDGISLGQVIEALESLMERSLVEVRETDTKNLYGVQPVIKKYLLANSAEGNRKCLDKITA
jgi:hypothetical protein